MFSPATRIALTRLAVLSVTLFLSACSSLFSNDFRDPSIHLVRVEVVRAKMLEQRFNLYFRVDNPNSVSLDIQDLSYSVFLNDIKLASGQSNISFTLSPNSTTEIKVPVRSNLWRNLKQVIKMLKNPHEPITYRLEGQVEVGSWFGRNVQLQRSGEIIPGNFIPE